ncbi:unnamed protein product [Rotaria sp. Silwood2]|nr:unnamed protein product [Rotaria sp. Silwood2]CAF4377931.1 unnamed protein product [Rotaria sp. Silwood2]
MVIKEKCETKKLIVLPIDEEIKAVVSSFIHIFEQTGYIESAPKCYERLHNIAKLIVSSSVNDENEDEKTEDDKSHNDKIEYNKSNDETIEDDDRKYYKHHSNFEADERKKMKSEPY